MRVIRKIGPLFAIGILIAVSAAAQYWPKPAATPGVDVTCTGCLEFRNGKLTPGYPATIQTFTGRFLDSQATQDYQQPFKTARAESVVVMAIVSQEAQLRNGRGSRPDSGIGPLWRGTLFSPFGFTELTQP